MTTSVCLRKPFVIRKIQNKVNFIAEYRDLNSKSSSTKTDYLSNAKKPSLYYNILGGKSWAEFRFFHLLDMLCNQC